MECVSPCSLAAEKGTYSKTFWWLDAGVPHVLKFWVVSGSVANAGRQGALRKTQTRQAMFPGTFIGEAHVFSI